MEYSIGDLSKITRISGKTLHQYHLEGLVEPTRVDKFSRRRYFDEKTLHRVEVVHRFHALGIPAEIIREVLAKHKDTRHLVKLLLHSHKEVDRAWEKYGITHEIIQAFLNTQSLEKVILGKLEIKVLPDVLIASKRFHSLIAHVQPHLVELATACGSAVIGHPIVLFHDDHQFEDEMDLECGLPVSRELPDGGCNFRTLPGTRAVTIKYEGPSGGLWMGYQKIIDYLNKHNLAVQTPSREVWLNWQRSTLFDETAIRQVEIQFLIGDPNDPDFKRDISRPGYGIGANFDL